MKFTIVKERWYHKYLRGLAPKVAPEYEIHLATKMGCKNGKYYLYDPQYYEFDLNSTTERKRHPLLEEPLNGFNPVMVENIIID